MFSGVGVYKVVCWVVFALGVVSGRLVVRGLGIFSFEFSPFLLGFHHQHRIFQSGILWHLSLALQSYFSL